MEAVNDFNDAVSLGYINPTNDPSFPIANTSNIDPYASVEGSALNSKMNSLRDAQGNILSTYTYGDPTINGTDLTQTALDVYGSSRLGIWKRNVDVLIKPPTLLPGAGDSLTFTRGSKLFELTNHLGNVLSIISDKRWGVSTNDSTVIYFNPDLVSANDYYPFGMLEPGRQYAQSMLGSYRFGFNGKENDNEVEGVGNQIDYGMRVYDPRIGKFLSVDPLFKSYPWNSSYSYAENEPISNVDLDGQEKYKVTIRTYLPYTYVWEPQSKDIIDKANTRWYPQYRNVEDHGGFKSQQQFDIDFYKATTTYLPPVVPATYRKDLTTGKVTEIGNAGLNGEGTMTTTFENTANIYAEISTKNPATPSWLPTPAIDYSLNISVSKDGTWVLNGKWDGFPALEIFIEDEETKQVDLM